MSGLNRAIVVIRAPVINGAAPVTVRPNKCEYGSTASTWSFGTSPIASCVARALLIRLRCVLIAPSGVPRIAEV